MDPNAFPFLASGSWALSEKHYMHQRGAKVSAADLHRATGTLVVGYSSGIFEMLQLPSFESLQVCVGGEEIPHRMLPLSYAPTLADAYCMSTPSPPSPTHPPPSHRP